MSYPQFEMIGDYTAKRFVLHHRGARTLVVVGCNPSKASDLEPDPTMQNVCRIAHANGYDGILMINLSAERTSWQNGRNSMSYAHLSKICRGERIRTFDPLLPKQVR